MATHAGIAYAAAHQKHIQQWESRSNSLVVLSTPTEFELLLYMKQYAHLPVVGFYEPDYNDELMSIAMLLNGNQAKMLRNLPLLLKKEK
jgi:hypothetical protein